MIIPHLGKEEVVAQILQSVGQALRVLTELRRRETVGVIEIADELDIGASTVHRILTTLQAYGYVQQTVSGRKYQLGPAMAHSGDAASIAHCVEVAQPVMLHLRDVSGETTHIAVLEGTETKFISVIESRHMLRVSSRVGLKMPAHTAASGKVLLAQLSDETIDELFPHEKFEQVTSRSPSTRTMFKKELKLVREEGFGRNFGGSEDGLAALAVPIRRPRGIPICSLTLTGPLTRFNPTGEPDVSARELELRQLLRAAADELEQRLEF